MKCDKKGLLLYAVTDRSWLNGETLYSQVEKALQGGATFIQLREKNLDQDHFMEEALELKKLCAAYHVPFVINDNVEIAAKMDADGVHVGQSDMEAGDVRAKLGPDKIIGVSAQTVEQAILAEQRGADYLGVGAVFHTGSKADAEDVSHETLTAICNAVKIPVIAIGGITRDNVTELSGSGICVVDPVLVATSGSALASGGVPDLMKKLLFPLAEVITPNIPEGEVLSGIKIQSESDMERAAKEIGDSCGCAVLLKGGHSINDANDLLYHNGTFTWFTGKRINTPNTHGTGCTLSSAIASGLAKGLSLPDAMSAAKEYISGALASMMDLGHGSGPLNHAYRI